VLHYAIVGATGYAGSHIRRIEAHGEALGCRVSAVTIRPADRLDGQVEQFAAKGAAVFADAVEMFDALAGKVDGVFIPTGIYTHCELTCAALERGHNVYVEKPPAATVQEVDRMLAAARGSGRVCLLGFQAVFGPGINFIKDRVVSGALGEVRRLRAWALWPRPDSYYARNEWAGRLKVGDSWVLDGPTNNALSHEISNMLYLASPRRRAFATPRAVRAELYHARDIESEDTSAVEIHTAEGAVACFVVSHCTAGEHVGPWIEIDCANGRARRTFGGPAEVTYADGRVESLPVEGADPGLAPLANFTEAVRAGDPQLVRCDLAMGRNFTLALNGAFESSRKTHAIDRRFVRRAGAGPEATTVVDGLDEAISRCGPQGRLYSDIGCPWAVKTDPFDLTGYARFPAVFGSGPAS